MSQNRSFPLSYLCQVFCHPLGTVNEFSAVGHFLSAHPRAMQGRVWTLPYTRSFSHMAYFWPQKILGHSRPEKILGVSAKPKEVAFLFCSVTKAIGQPSSHCPLESQTIARCWLQGPYRKLFKWLGILPAGPEVTQPHPSLHVLHRGENGLAARSLWHFLLSTSLWVSKVEGLF
jgi:hypothetical protein